ncbi:MAG TPA: biopolymer transporter ExbD [Bryobacteraceae bacterium]|nr:biopolymer transporter ExbD [Bryobacteraceae bacterium]
MTPLIDVLLVLLIIFLVVLPEQSRGLKSLVPEDNPNATQSRPSDDIVISVSRDQKLRLNQEEISLANLDDHLRELLKLSPDPVIFVRGDRDIDFGDIAQVIDVARGAGISRVGLITH